MSPRLINALFATAAIATPACAIVEQANAFDYQWHRAAPPLRPVWVQVPTGRLIALCDHEARGFKGLACVRRNFELGLCFIFATVPREEVPGFVVHHEEEMHCNRGLNHD